MDIHVILVIIFLLGLLASLWSWLSRAGREGKKASAGCAIGQAAAQGDDLTRIKGVGPVIARKLNALGITRYAHIAAFSAADVARVDTVLDFKGRIEREGWIRQARELEAENSLKNKT